MRVKLLLALSAVGLVPATPATAATLISATVNGVTAAGTTTGTVWNTNSSDSFYTLFVRYPVSGPNNAPVLNPNDEPINVGVDSGLSQFLLAGEGYFPGVNADSDLIYRLTLGFAGGGTLTGIYTPTTNTFLAGSAAVIDGVSYSLSDFSFRRFGGDTVQAFTATPGGDPNDYVGSFQLSAAGVPEPSTWAMMIVGFGALGAVMRRRKVRATVSYT